MYNTYYQNRNSFSLKCYNFFPCVYYIGAQFFIQAQLFIFRHTSYIYYTLIFAKSTLIKFFENMILLKKKS